MRLRSFLLTSYFTLLTSGLLLGQGNFPKPEGRVNDFAGVLDASVEAEIDQLLADLERKTSSEVAVAVVRSLDGMSVEEYANRMFKAWGVGQAKEDNGVLVLVAPTEREMRIEVGYGLEGVLPDGLAGEIIREQFTPRFRDNDYPGGIRDGVRRVVEVVERHQVLTPEELARFNEESTDDAPPAAVIPFLGLFVAIGFFMIGGGIRTKAGFPLLFGGMFGGLPLLISLGIAFTLSLFTLFPLALAMFVWGYRMGGRESIRNSMRQGKSGSGWVMGTGERSSSDSDSDSSSSSSSSDSSSFGGGSSGGGGASGKW